MAAISIRITTATYANAGAACTDGPAAIVSQDGDQTLWYNDDGGNGNTLSLSNIPVGGLQLYNEEALTTTWAGDSGFYYCNNAGGSSVDCAIEVIDTGKIGAVTYCSPTVSPGTETVAVGGSIDILIHDLIEDNIDPDSGLTVTFSTPTLGTLGT